MFELSPNVLRGLPRALPVIAWMITLGARTSMCDKHDYCWESFNVTCAQDEVIVMSTARYGRMKFGKCLERDYFVGCSADILSYMDRKCSGRRSCAIDIPDTELHKMQPCPKDLLVYLEADYMCVKVADDRDICRHHHHSISTAAGSPGYIANLITAETGHGSSSCPWLITVRPGQRINVTLLDFAVAGNLGRTGSHVCVRYGNLRETMKGSTDVTICGGEKRERLVYMSEGNSLTVEVMNTNLLQERPYFILKYEAVGCSDLRAPPHGWIDRQGDRATVSCNNSADVWHLVCNVDTWIGTYHNCTTAEYISEGFSHATPTYPLGVFVAVTIGIALGVFSGLLLLSMVVCCQRKSGTGKCFGASSMEEETEAACGLEKAHILLSDKFYYDIVARDMAHGCHLTRSGAGESCTCGTTTLLLPPPSTTTAVEFDSAYLATKCARSNAVHSSREHSYESPRVKLKGQQELIQCEFETEGRVPPQGEDVNCRDCDTEQMGTDRYT